MSAARTTATPEVVCQHARTSVLVRVLVNAVVRPVVELLPLPLTLVVDRFFWSAVLGALVVGVVSWLLALLVPERHRHRV